jgi:hypothetical protein
MSVIATIEADLHAIWTKLEAEGHSVADEVKSVLDRLKADAPKMAVEVETDAADVVKTAETQGVQPAFAEAENDGVALVADAEHDVAAAVEGSAKAEAAPEASG